MFVDAEAEREITKRGPKKAHPCGVELKRGSETHRNSNDT